MNIPSLFHSLVKRLRIGVSQDPARDWIVMLTFTVIILAGVIIWNVWAFDTVARGGTIGPAQTSSVPLVGNSSFEAIHAIFEKRAIEEVKYETGSYRYADPSQ